MCMFVCMLTTCMNRDATRGSWPYIAGERQATASQSMNIENVPSFYPRLQVMFCKETLTIGVNRNLYTYCGLFSCKSKTCRASGNSMKASLGLGIDCLVNTPYYLQHILYIFREPFFSFLSFLRSSPFLSFFASLDL